MKVGSTFSGVGGFDLGLERAGMEIVWQAEIDQWCRKVLESHWPDIKIYNDVKEINDSAEPVELLVGGFPCQDLSIAGRRAGLAGEKSSLFFEFARISRELRPKWFLLENVAGLLSSSDGRDFAIVLSEMAALGYGISWRILDARFFGTAQRRRRVFIVGHLGKDGCKQAVRALGTGSEGNVEASRSSWQNNQTRSKEGIEPARCITSSNERLAIDAENFVIANSLSGGDPKRGFRLDVEAAVGNHVIMDEDVVVRRLTPLECERLMSWPDNWTLMDGDTSPDSRRYAACGNGVVSNVSEWIARRIMAIENEQ